MTPASGFSHPLFACIAVLIFRAVVRSEQRDNPFEIQFRGLRRFFAQRHREG